MRVYEDMTSKVRYTDVVSHSTKEPSMTVVGLDSSYIVELCLPSEFKDKFVALTCMLDIKTVLTASSVVAMFDDSTTAIDVVSALSDAGVAFILHKR